LAARLYKLPLKMLEYVTNTVAYQPYVGAMKGPLATLLTKAGNDWDTNSLLAALYASAGINTRYVEGVAEVTSQQLMDYVGTRDAAAAGNILRQAGLQYDEFYNHFKHTWLEAQVIVPAKVDPAKVEPLWVPLDASWKLRDYRPGLPGVLASVPFSPLESDYLTNSVWQKKSTAEYYEAKVATWLAQNRPGFTIADVGYDGPIRQQAFKALPTELPFTPWSQPTELARPKQIPDTANWKVNIKLASGPSQLFGSLGANISLADVSLSRLTIDPGLFGTGSSQTAQPVLRRDGATIATAPKAFATIASNGSMTQLTLAITVTAPGGGSYTRSFTRAADRFIAIGLDANQFSEPLLVGKRAIVNAQQLNQANKATVANEQAVGGLLDLAIAQYFLSADADEAALATLTSAVPDRTNVALGIATSAAVLSAAVLSDPTSDKARLQFPYLPDDIGIDVPANTWGGFAIDASTPTTPQDDRTRDVLMGYTKSSLEGLVLEALTNCESISTIKAFQLSKFGQDPKNLVEINNGNVSAINSLLPGVGQNIRDAIAKGLGELSKNDPGFTFKALVPKTEITVGGSETNTQWKGVGYTLTRVSTDPALNGKTLFFMICGSVGNQPLVTYGGASGRTVTKTFEPKSTVSTSNPDSSAGDPVN
ncbi:MAG: transglutaminase domain-containing protein, partial [Planctomycetota bacterium]